MDAESKFNQADINGDGVNTPNTSLSFFSCHFNLTEKNPKINGQTMRSWTGQILHYIYFLQQIDKDELDRVLSQHVTLFTPNMIQELIKEIDQDDNDTLEFVEILTVKAQVLKQASKILLPSAHPHS
jgi:lipoate-protein ligase A